MDEARILLIDSYDSFTHNLAALCRQAIPQSRIHIIKNDALSIHQLIPHLPKFDAIVVGPGPGSPAHPADIGIVRDLWKLEEHLLPIFGVCLGLQSLALEFGGKVSRLRVVKHGQISPIVHTGSDLFADVGAIEAVRYHSLHASLNDGEHLEELAWANDGEENGRVIMAIRHRSKPYWAVQYHPESVRTSGGGLEVLKNFWRLSNEWESLRARKRYKWDEEIETLVGPAWPSLSFSLQRGMNVLSKKIHVQTRIIDSPLLSSVEVAEHFGATDENARLVLLDSAAKPGRFSIIGSLMTSSRQYTHYTHENHVSITYSGTTEQIPLRELDIWSWMENHMRPYENVVGHEDVPFWGGFVGYLSYELGCQHLAPLPTRRDKSAPAPRVHPDLNLVFVERSVVLDKVTGRAYVQSILPKDDGWISDTVRSLRELDASLRCRVGSKVVSSEECPKPKPSITLPSRSHYLASIETAKAHLAAGNSYEICLTAQTRVTLAVQDVNRDRSSSWEMYKRLRKHNPAPHSAYLRLNPSTVLSSSPERFLSFSRPPNPTYQLRPIKGTLRKGPDIQRADAERHLVGSVKEVAENLMIVDLIRHDLHGVVGEQVHVSQFCGIEEYETVWQMVSVVEGQSSPSRCDEPGERNSQGWHVLRHCLPPGSMTGAPKKRSVEILRELEREPRGIYSGVLGYWDIGGGGDWAVVIRSCFKHESQSRVPNATENEDLGGTKLGHPPLEEWTIGAGGAITALSDAQAEWEEMVLKLQSVLGVFKANPSLSPPQGPTL